MDCSRNLQLHITRLEEFALSQTHPSRSPPIRTSSVENFRRSVERKEITT
jgi:hypothetical protein